MKKIISLILVCLLLPVVSLLLVGCNKDSYNLTTFYTTYENIVNNTPYLTLVNSNDTYHLDVDSQKIIINYNKATSLKTAISSKPYNYIDTLYQQLLDDTLAPVYFFGQTVASSNRLNKDQTKELFEKLHSLQYEYE